MSALDRVPSPGALLILLLMAMLGLATFIGLTHNDAAVRLLKLCIPFVGVLFAMVVLSKEDSQPERAVAVVVVGACVVSFYLAVVGDGPFSNELVDLVIISGAIAVQALDAKDGKKGRRKRSRTKAAEFWDDPKSALPDSESVLIVALLAVGTVVFLDTAGFHSIANLEDGIRHVDPLRLLLLVALPVGAKVASLVRYRFEDSEMPRDE